MVEPRYLATAISRLKCMRSRPSVRCSEQMDSSRQHEQPLRAEDRRLDSLHALSELDQWRLIDAYQAATRPVKIEYDKRHKEDQEIEPEREAHVTLSGLSQRMAGHGTAQDERQSQQPNHRRRHVIAPQPFPGRGEIDHLVSGGDDCTGER